MPEVGEGVGLTGIDTDEDVARIKRCHAAVLSMVLDLQWHDGPEFEAIGGGAEGKRRFRDIRRGWLWEKRHVGKGLWSYRLIRLLTPEEEWQLQKEKWDRRKKPMKKKGIQ